MTPQVAQNKPKITITSFGWKHRQRPPDQDYYIDAWLLPNPYKQAPHETGLDRVVADWLVAQPGVLKQLGQWWDVIVNRKPEKIAVGCLGGRHRSVWTAERLAERLRERGHEVEVVHLELRRNEN